MDAEVACSSMQEIEHGAKLYVSCRNILLQVEDLADFVAFFWCAHRPETLKLCIVK